LIRTLFNKAISTAFVVAESKHSVLSKGLKMLIANAFQSTTVAFAWRNEVTQR